MARIYLNNDWYFTKEFSEALFEADDDNENLQKVRIPHSVCTTGLNYVNENVYQMVSGYRKVIHIQDEWREGHLILTFEGAAHEATVYVNGQQAVKHFGGYTAFLVDIIPFLKEGSEQVITVRLDSRETLNQPPFGGDIDYLTYGGIYRDVYLDVKDNYYIEDIYTATPNALMDKKTLKVEVTVNEWVEGLTIAARLDTWTEIEVTDEEDDLQHWVFDETSARFRISCLTYTVENAYVWDVEMPNLYVLTVDLKKDGEVIDSKQVRVGFREAVFEEDGFYLNGRRLQLRGLNRHQSWPYVGYAMPKTPQQLDADLLKFELGANVVRTSHYPQSQHFINRCDELGLLVLTEMPGWQHIGDQRWKKVAVRNVREMVTQYRNHPSIIAWGVRINESPDCDALYYKTNRLAHELDVYRQTMGVRNIKNSHLFEDVYTYNEFVHRGDNIGCEKKKDVTSDMNKPYMVTEYAGHMFPTKMNEPEDKRLKHALFHTKIVNDIMENEDIVGSTGWCMFDYNTHQNFGSGDGICYHGVMDMFRNPKLAAAFYKSQSDDELVFEISSSMINTQYPVGELGDVYAFTNADSVKLYKNGQFVKQFYPDDDNYGALVHPPIKIDDMVGRLLVDEEGLDEKTAKSLKVIFDDMRENNGRLPKLTKAGLRAFLKAGHLSEEKMMALYEKYMMPSYTVTSWKFEAIKDGEVVGEVLREPAAQTMLQIMTDRQTLVEDYTYDVATVHIEALDQNGNHLFNYEDGIVLKTEGDIEIIGPSIVSLKGGYGGTYLRSLGGEGEGKLIVSDASGEAVIAFNVVVKK